MDLIKTGKFLAGLRRQKGLTQEQLGEKLGVTNKTVSRWENGNYLPPVEALQQLSQLYNVSINEILCGEILENEDFREKSEENIADILQESSFTYKERAEFFKRKWKKEHTFSFITDIIFCLAVFIAGIVLRWGWLVCLAVILSSAVSIIRYNRMMAYVEQHIYDLSASARNTGR